MKRDISREQVGSQHSGEGHCRLFENVKKQKNCLEKKQKKWFKKKLEKMSRRENVAAPLSFLDDNGLTIVRLSATDSAPNSRTWNALYKMCRNTISDADSSPNNKTVPDWSLARTKAELSSFSVLPPEFIHCCAVCGVRVHQYSVSIGVLHNRRVSVHVGVNS